MGQRSPRAARLAASLIVATLVWAAGCGGGGDAADAGSFGADGAFAGDGGVASLVAPPAIPWYDLETGEGEPDVAPPSFWPCPDGWREVTTDTGLEVCDPFPTGGASSCPEDQAHFAGEPTCTTIGTACPAGDFPEGLPAAVPVRHVLAGAAPGGDGTQARPFASIGDATAGAPPGTIVAIGKGRYDELVTVPGGVTLWGACVAETVVTQSAGVAPGFAGGVITVTQPGASVRNLQVADGELIGVWVSGAGALDLDDFVLSACRTQGIFALAGGRITARSVAVRDMRPRARDLSSGSAFGAEGGALDLSRVIVERVSYGGIVSIGGEVRARDVVVRNIEPDPQTGVGGYGIIAGERGVLDLAQVLVEDAHGVGIGAQGLGASITASDVVVRGTRPEATDLMVSAGAGVLRGAMGTWSRLFIEDIAGDGIYVSDDSVVVVADAVVRDVFQVTADIPGTGIYAGTDPGRPATFTLERAVVEHTEIGIGIIGADQTATLSDIRIRDTRHAPDDEYSGAPALLVHGALVTLTRGTIDRTFANAIEVRDPTARATLVDVAVRDARSNPMGFGFGIGILGDTQAGVEASRLVIERVEGTDVLLTGGATAHLADVVLRDGRPLSDTQRLGRATGIQVGSTLELERAVIEGHHGFSLLAIQLSHIRGTDVRIGATRAEGCVETTCADNPGGSAVVSTATSGVVLQRFLVDGADLCGVMVARGAALDLRIGEVRGAAIGACVQIPDYDTGRLSELVYYRDNGHNLQATSLPVPDVTSLP